MKITCVVDNLVEHASPLWGEHGLAFVIETSNGRVLFDTGQSGRVLMHNLKELQFAPKDFTAIVASHSHYDHSGGLQAFLKESPVLAFYAHPDFFVERFTTRKNKAPQPIGLPMSTKKLRKHVALQLSAEPMEVLPGLWTSGSIRNRPEPEGRSKRHVIYQNGQLVPDPYSDDLSLVWNSGNGLVVILGCAHAGVLNILAQISAFFKQPVRAVIGGTHLHRAQEDELKHVSQRLREHYGNPQLYPNHCTGISGLLALHRELGDRVKPCPAGTVLEF